MDRHYRWLVRAGTGVGGVLVGFLTLWTAGVDPTQWFKASREPQQTKPKSAQTQPADPWSVQPSTITKPLAGNDASVSRKPLGLVVTATAPGRNIFEGTASLGTVKENPQTYGAGAILSNGARLAEIHPDYVVLERNGRSARLYLQSSGKQDADGVSELLSVGGVGQPAATKPTNTESITAYVRPNPVYEGDVLRGFEVYPGKKSAVFATLGLQAGDLIVAMDGAPFTNPAQAYATFGQLMNGVAMIATVNRNGRTANISLDGSVIAADQRRK